MDPRVSIIVPVYNVEKYITSCIFSLKKQTYTNIEVLLVDDGSTDESGLICDSQASNNNWIIIHKENGGLSDARNVGIANASGDYLYFLDSDDLIHPQTIELLVKAALETKADIVEADHFKCPETKIRHSWNLPKGKNIPTVWKQPQILKNVLLSIDSSIIACNKLIKRSTLASIEFPVGKYHEDEFTIPFIAERAQIYTRLHIPLYLYLQRPSSIMHEGYSKKRLDAVEAFEKRYYYFSDGYLGVLDEIVAYSLGTICSKFLIEFRGALAKNEKASLEKLKTMAFRNVGTAKQLPLKQRISFACQKISPLLFWTIILYFEQKA